MGLLHVHYVSKMHSEPYCILWYGKTEKEVNYLSKKKTKDLLSSNHIEKKTTFCSGTNDVSNIEMAQKIERGVDDRVTKKFFALKIVFAR